MNIRGLLTVTAPMLLAIDALAAPPEPIVFREVLAIERLGIRGRSADTSDSLEFAMAQGTWQPPRSGDAVMATTGEQRTWEVQHASKEGQFTGRPFQGGWAYVSVDVPWEGPWRLQASGHSCVYVDGVPRGGDVYQNGVTRLPLALAAGPHSFLFRCGRGALAATLEPAPAAIYFEDVDRTLPDLIVGETEPVSLGVIVANATNAEVRGMSVVARAGEYETRTQLPVLAPASGRKMPISLAVPANFPAGQDQAAVHLDLFANDRTRLHTTDFEVRVRQPRQQHARTFISSIDGSVQYYAVTPPVRTDTDRPTGLLLTLHGASVEARNQAWSYQPKEDLWIVAPTNRRPFGFDWEDWGRIDAIEVLEIAASRFGTDPRRTYLTGHSMGGHGTWQIGAHYPDRFAAIAPSAGWCDFWGYGGGGTVPESPIGRMFDRAANASRTLLLESNYSSQGVYILHGDADDNVPVSEARGMRARLGAFHPNFSYYEQPGAGHWWGNECVDWPPLFTFLQQNERSRDDATRRLVFATVSPAISSTYHWLTVEAADRWMEPCRVDVELKPEERLLKLQQENVAAISFDLVAAGLAPDSAVRLEMDGHTVTGSSPAAGTRLCLSRGSEGTWHVIPPRDPQLKGPHRAGPFKEAFRRRMVFVYGTQGTAEENAWAFAKARFDQETWQYRANGSVDVIRDIDFSPPAFRHRNLILYGNADTNAAWTQIVDPSTLHVERGRLRCGDREWTGTDLALLAVTPRRDSHVASVGLISGTGLPGMRTLDGLPYFVSGVGYPDWTVLRTRCLQDGLSGIEAAGFFGNDWKLE